MLRRTKQGSVHVIQSTSPFNDEVIDEFRSVGQSCLSEGNAMIVVDLTNVSLINGAMLECLADLQSQCLSRGGAVKITNPNPLCRDILRVTGLDEQIELKSDVLTAAGSFSE